MPSLDQEYGELIDNRMRALSNRQYRILVVDDEEVFVEMVTSMLRSEPYAFLQAGDGVKASEVVQSEEVHLIISDIRMPNMLGTQFVEGLRENNNNTPVIFITGFADHELMSDAIRLQPFGFLEKPFDVKALRKLVRRAHNEHVQEVAREMQAVILSELVEQKTRDIRFRTDRLMAEQQLLQGIISQATFGLIAVDTFGIVHLLNDYAASRSMRTGGLGVNCQGQPLKELLAPELKEGFMQMLKLASTGGDRQESVVHVPNSELTLKILAYPIRFREEVTAIVFVIHDITDQELLQRRLVQSAKLASIGELAAGVAHEINNPVGFVTSNINTLGDYWRKLEDYFVFVHSSANASQPNFDQLLSRASAEFDLDYIRSDVPALLTETADGLSRVAKIVSDLKTFARADNPQPELSDVTSIIEDSLNLCRNVTKYNLEIVRNYEKVPAILCFPAQLVQVCTNLIVNAAHATVDKGKLIVSVTSDDKDISIQFCDNGTGISPEILPRIFDPFFTTKEPGKGTGMGLSISYGIVQRHGGSISVKSVPGEGTEFTVKLPIQAHSCLEAGAPAEMELR